MTDTPGTAADLALKRDIEAELEFEPRLDAAGIGVSVRKGVVSLTGHVSSYAEKLAAEHAASLVKGVAGLVEEIEVRTPHDRVVDDSEIAARAVNLLAWTVPALRETIPLKVEKGVVTLTGEVDWHFQRQAAESAMRQIRGVVGVRNCIRVRPKISPDDVRNQISKAHHRHSALEASGIRISVEGSTVTLSGTVKAWHERRLAEAAAWAVPGVNQVVDDLRVG